MNEAIEILMERYINGEMNPNEIRDFEDRLGNDPEFATAYKNTIAVHELIEEAGRIDMKQTLESFDKRTSRTGVIPLWIKRSLPIAAALAVFAGVYMFGFFSTSMTTDEAFNTYFEAYGPPSELRDTGADQNRNWKAAVREYSNGNYREALLLFEIAGDNIHFTTVEFYQGMSYLLLDYPDYHDAEYYLNEVRLEDSDYKEQALWYYALTVLKQGKQDEAEEVFRAIVKARSYNFKKAQAILKVKIED